MRTDTLSSSLGAVLGLLTSDCLRYAVAKASICPFWGACNLRQFNYFRSDSPLTFPSFWFRIGDVGDAFRVCLFLALQSPALHSPASRLQPRTNADCSFIGSSRRFAPLVLRLTCLNEFTFGSTLESPVCHLATALSVVVRLDCGSR
jgi:hypothetical protein